MSEEKEVSIVRQKLMQAKIQDNGLQLDSKAQDAREDRTDAKASDDMSESLSSPKMRLLNAKSQDKYFEGEVESYRFIGL